MKKSGFIALLLLVVLGFGIAGCDNRSQAEKDMDKAAKQAESAAKDAQKKLGL